MSIFRSEGRLADWPAEVKGRRIAQRLSGLKARAAQFADDTAGDVMIMFGLMTIAMFMMVGLAIDMGRWLNARDQTVSAADAAVLAAARALQTNGGNQAAALQIARNYYAQLTKDRLSVKTDTVNFVIADNGSAVKTTGNADIATPFMGLAGIRTLPLMRASGADYSKAVLAVGGNAETNIEISMMLDVSGSMSGTKLSDMKLAAKDLVDIVVWQNQSEYTSKISLVPFSDDVRPPTSVFNLVTNLLAPATVTKTKSGKSYVYKRTDCVVERTGTNKYKDTLPIVGDWLLRNYTSTGSCVTPEASSVVPMTNDKTTLKNKIDALALGGGTAGQVGTAWAYYMLSPKWTSVLPILSQPVLFGGSTTKKIAVLMTDGEYNATHDSTGVDTDSTGAGSTVNGNSAADQAKEICTKMKADGIEVYTVGFDLGGNATAISTLSNCATDSAHFYNTSTGDDLRQAFRDIALKISSLYLAE